MFAQSALKLCKYSSASLRLNLTARGQLIRPLLVAGVQKRFASTEPLDLSKIKVYTGSLASKMKAVKLFSITTSLMGAAVQPVLLEQSMKIGGAPMAVAACTVAGFFTFVTPMLLHFVTKKYVTELYFNETTGEYTAITISLILTKVETKFKPEEVVVPDVPGMFTSFLVGKKALFVEPTLFTDPEHYVKIMGYDKPVDFKLNLTEPEDSKPKDK